MSSTTAAGGFSTVHRKSSARKSRASGAALPGFFGNGIGSGSDANYDPESGYLLATVEYQVVDPSRPLNFELNVGRNAIADWDGNIPTVHFGDPAQPAVPGSRPITLPPVPTELPPSSTEQQPNELVDPTLKFNQWPSDWNIIDVQQWIGIVGEGRWAQRYFIDEDGASEPLDFISWGSPVSFLLDGNIIEAGYSDGSYSIEDGSYSIEVFQTRLATMYSTAGADMIGAALAQGSP